MQFIVIIEQDEDGVFIGSIPGIPGCHAEGETQEEMMKELNQVAKLCLRNASEKEIGKNRFIGIQNLVLSHA